MEPIIKAVREAFSMQPETWTVCGKEMDFHTFTPDVVHKHNKSCIEKITQRQVGPHDYEYHAFNFDGDLIAIFQGKSVNVFYEEELK